MLINEPVDVWFMKIGNTSIHRVTLTQKDCIPVSASALVDKPTYGNVNSKSWSSLASKYSMSILISRLLSGYCKEKTNTLNIFNISKFGKNER